MGALTDRVRERLRREGRRLNQLRIAELLDMSQGNVSKTIHQDDRPITLDFLEAAAAVSGIPPAELVSEDGAIYQLSADEALIVRALRAWPLTVRRALCQFVVFFANEEPQAGQTRRMHELWRHLDARSRLAVYGFAVEKSQGAIPPEIEARLFEDLSAESKAALEKHEKRRRRVPP
jgi:transcriptional regulator with XRE-family HTH domain